ncbi:MAG TPA: metallophosphoesterase [Dongiaceae bacterium]|nr:metallophosphoesterase [Dongiaceae bacterium]
MSVLLQISDTHFGTEQEPVMQALQILHAELRPDVVIVSGDITQRATRAQFHCAQQFFESLNPKALLAIPGNHDIPLFNPFLRLLAPYSHYHQAFGRNLQPEFTSHDLLILCVNTTRRWRHKNGEVSAAQIQAVAQRLAAAEAAQLRVVVTHQPVHIITTSDRNNLLRGHQTALHAWAGAGADLILGGHIHLPYVSRLQPLPQQPHQALWAVQAGTALSTRIRSGMPNSVNVVRYQYADGRRTCSVEQWDFNRQYNEFKPVSITPLLPDLNG